MYLHHTNIDSVLRMERKIVDIIFNCRLPIRPFPQLHLVGQQRRSHLGNETIRQVSIIYDWKSPKITFTNIYLSRRTISATENLSVATLTFGEGFHNYHHAFPWDYKAAELGNYAFNMSTAFIDLFAKIGWAYDMKVASKEIVLQRRKRTGDGSHSHDNEIWGWDDADMTSEEKNLVEIINQEKNDWITPKNLYIDIENFSTNFLHQNGLK